MYLEQIISNQFSQKTLNFFLTLDSPICKPSNKRVGSVVGSNVTVICDVDAYPRENMFQWWFLGQGHKTQKRMLSNEHRQTYLHRYMNTVLSKLLLIDKKKVPKKH